MTERKDENLPIHSQFGDVEEFAPFKVVSLFETIEHLSISELDNFLHESEKILEPSGGILISAPIEIGPALILKELNRSIFRLKFSEYRPFELLKAALLGVPGRRAMNIKTSHKGFDFRESIELLSQRGWNVEVLGYGPLPTGTWYGNSQVFLWATKK
jgi:hypothetical protein